MNIARLSSLLFIFSPAVYSQSRYFYPDHWIYFFSSIVFFLVVKSFSKKSNSLILLIGFVVGLAASLKYTGFYLLFPISMSLVFGFLFDRNRLTFSNLILKISTLLVGISITFALINFSAFINLESFKSQFLANAENYGINQGNVFIGGRYYLLIILLLFFGVFGWIFIVAGFVQIWKTHKKLFCIIFATIIFYVLYMGSAKLVINRNVNILFPFIFPVMAIGIYFLYQNVKDRFSSKICYSLDTQSAR